MPLTDPLLKRVDLDAQTVPSLRPTGITTQDPNLTAGLVSTDKRVRIARYMEPSGSNLKSGPTRPSGSNAFRWVRVVLGALLLSGALNSTASEALYLQPVSGYAKQFVTLFDSPLRSGADALITGRLRLNTAIGHGPFELALGFDIIPRLESSQQARDSGLPAPTGGNYRLVDAQHRLLPRDGSGQLELFQNVDRLALSLTQGRLALTLGRQSLSFGEALELSATDVIAPFTYQDIDTEERIGVDALRLRWALGTRSNIDIGWIVGDGADPHLSAGFARLHLHWAGADITPLTIWFRQHLLMGLSAARPLGSAGLYLDAARLLMREDEDFTRWSVGIRRKLHPMVDSSIEFHRIGAGNATIDVESGPPHASAYRDAGAYLLAQNYLAPAITWQMTPTGTMRMRALVNLHDGSWLAGPRVEFSLREDLIAEAGLYKGFAALPTIRRHRNPEFVLHGRTLYADVRRYF